MERMFSYEKETKNTVRFQEDECDEAPAVGTLYVQKFAWKSLGSPVNLVVTIEAK